MKVFISFLFIIFLCFTAGQQCYSKTYKIYDVDFVEVAGLRYKGDFLGFGFNYYDQSDGQPVFWKEKSADCQCDVFILTGKYADKNQPIVSHRKFLNKYDENFIFDLPVKKLTSEDVGKIKCVFQIGWKNLVIDSNFRF